MKNRITELFSRKRENILSIFFTAGFPSLDDTILIAQELERSGVDLIEIGIPFSDPVADGPTIQASNKTALENGMTLVLLLEQLRLIRKSTSIPIVLMGYLNPVLQYGMERFIKDAKEVGADGFILPDLPIKEYELNYKSKMEDQNLSMTFLISPTTSEERIQKIDSLSSGFIYAVSASSTTGSKQNFDENQLNYFNRISALHLKNPTLIGFGISNHQTFSTACQSASGAIIGSAFINMLASSTDLREDIQHFIHSIRNK